MEKLIKPVMSIEDYSDEMVEALCEHDGCNGNCRCDNIDCTACKSISSVNIDEDILF